jgi:tripeptidyl-peptidase I
VQLGLTFIISCQNYVVAVDGAFELVYGTSCSSPVSGAIFTMINDARLAAGKGPIGFINPTVRPHHFFVPFLADDLWC